MGQKTTVKKEIIFFLNMHDRFFRWFGDFLKEGKVFLPVFFYLKKLFFANF